MIYFLKDHNVKDIYQINVYDGNFFGHDFFYIHELVNYHQPNTKITSSNKSLSKQLKYTTFQSKW